MRLNLFGIEITIEWPSAHYRAMSAIKIGQRMNVNSPYRKNESEVFGGVKCLNNYPKARKIYVQIEHSDGESKFHSIRYDHFMFRNFILLNTATGCGNIEGQETESFLDMAEREMNVAAKKEEYEKAEAIKGMIEAINKKQ